MFKCCLGSVCILGFLLVIFSNANESLEEEIVNTFIEIPSVSDYTKLVTSNIRKYQQVTKQVVGIYFKKGSCIPKFKSKDFKASNYTRKEIPTNLQTLTVLYGPEANTEIGWTKQFLLKAVERPIQISYNSFPTTMKFANIFFITNISAKKNEMMSFFKKAEQYFGPNQQYNIIMLDISGSTELKLIQPIAEKVKYFLSPMAFPKINNSLVVPMFDASLQPLASLLPIGDREIDFLIHDKSAAVIDIVSAHNDKYYIISDKLEASYRYHNAKFTISKDKNVINEAVSYGSIPIVSEGGFSEMLKFVHNSNLEGIIEFLSAEIKKKSPLLRDFQKQILECWGTIPPLIQF